MNDWWTTVQAAIEGWGPTVRLAILMAVAAACWIFVGLYG